MRTMLPSCVALLCAAVAVTSAQGPSKPGSGAGPGQVLDGERNFEDETFGGNGRTCLTCHSKDTGTVSPEDAQKRFAKDHNDPLFRHDGSDNGLGQGVSRMLTDATVLVTIKLHDNVSLGDDPGARTVTLRRAILSTLNTPALDDVGCAVPGRAAQHRGVPENQWLLHVAGAAALCARARPGA